MKKLPKFIIELNEGDIDFRATILLQMKQKKISIAKLARDADLNYGTVFYFLKGTSEMKLSNLCKLFNILIKTKLDKPLITGRQKK